MAQTHSWLSLAEAASVLDIREYQVLDLAVSGWLRSRVDVDHRELSAADVEEFASELDVSRGALLAESKPTVRGGDPIGHEAEQDYELSRADYDITPNDEGDDE